VLQPGMRVVIMTSRGDWDTYMEALSDRVLDYVQKPVRREELLALVRKAFA
jgi:DNA-binding NtrC family response regulator